MTNDHEDKPGGEDQDEESTEDRPTVAPPFDPVEFAKGVLGGRPSPAAGTKATKPADPQAGRKTPMGVGRPQMPTLTDPAELEEARQLSATTAVPAAPGRSTTPQGLLSLANSRIPSNLPPAIDRRGGRAGSSDSVGAVDREWEELATSPPPATQQALIDAFTRGDDPPSTKDAASLVAAVAASPDATPSLPPAAEPSLLTPIPGAPAPPPNIPPAPTAQEMNDRVSLGDYSGALEIAEALLESDPDNDPVRQCAESCRGVLKQMYITRIGPLDRVPIVMVARDQMRWLSIDHRAGFVLSLVDGVSSLEMILDVSGMPLLDTLRILSELAQQRIISFR